MRRFEWTRADLLSRVVNGIGWRRIFLVARKTQDALAAIPGWFWKRYFRSRARGRHGATCRWVLANGTASSDVSDAGRNAVFSNVFSRQSREIQTLSMFSLMARFSALTRRRAAQKGDSQSGHWALQRWLDGQSSCAHRCLGQSRPFQIAARPAQ